MSQPHPANIHGVVDAVRRTGSVHFLLDQVPGDFGSWRRAVRQHARAEQLTASIRRVTPLVVIENLDDEVSPDDMGALADVIGEGIEGRSIAFGEALRARLRARLRLVTESEPANADHLRSDGAPK